MSAAVDPSLSAEPHRRALWGLALAYFVSFASGGIQLPLLALAMEKAGYAPTTIGAMWAMRSLMAAGVPVLWGVLADRLGSAKPLLVAALSIGSVLLLWLSTSPSPSTCVLIFALYGMFTNPSGSLMDGMTLTALGARRQEFGRWRAFGTIGFGASTLTTTTLLAYGVLAPLPGSLFPVCAAFTGSAAVVVALLVPRVPRPALTDLRLVGTAFTQPALLGLVAIGTLLWASHAGYASFLAPLTERVGFSPTVIGATVAGAVIVEAVVMSVSPWITARVRARTIIVGVAALATVRWLIAASITTSPLAFVLIQASHGVTFGLFFVVMTGLVAERVPVELRQASQGLLSSLSFGLGGFVGGLACGAAMESSSTAAPTWLAMAGLSLASMALGLFVTRRLR